MVTERTVVSHVEQHLLRIEQEEMPVDEDH
jgi:hypothetical protein